MRVILIRHSGLQADYVMKNVNMDASPLWGMYQSSWPVFRL